MSTHVLLTGASGFIGFRILLSLLAAGYKVRFTARSRQKLDIVTSNPALQRLQPGDRLEGVIVPDVAAENTFDQPMQGITHVLHVGSPIPHAGIVDPMNELYVPTIRLSTGILTAAFKNPSVKRVIITNSIGAIMPYSRDESTIITPFTRVPLDDGGVPPATLDNPVQTYKIAKIHELRNTENFMQTRSPHFSCATIFPAFVLGRNELLLNTRAALTENSSNMFVVMAITGKEVPAAPFGSYAHIDDVVDVHLKALFPETEEVARVTSFGIGSTVHFDAVFSVLHKDFAQAVADGILSQGKLSTRPLNYDSSETEKVLGLKFRSFESAVVDIASQYLELAKTEKA